MIDVRSMMRRAAQYNAERTAVIAGDRRLTFAEAWSRGMRLANALLERGVRPGDRVAVLEDNRLESSDFFVASTAGGFVRVPLYRRNSKEAHRHMLASTGARAVVVEANYVSDDQNADVARAKLEVELFRAELQYRQAYSRVKTLMGEK